MSTSEARVRPIIRLARPFVLALGVGASVFVAGAAHASQVFPSVVQKAYDMPCPPSCTLCHATDPGQATNFNKPFALMSVIPAAGVPLRGDEAKLKTALAKIKADGTDTDKDGTPGATELAEGNDPNKAGEVRLCGPSYGCGAHIAKAPAKNGGIWVLAACAALLVTFGFRRRAS